MDEKNVDWSAALARAEGAIADMRSEYDWVWAAEEEHQVTEILEYFRARVDGRPCSEPKFDFFRLSHRLPEWIITGKATPGTYVVTVAEDGSETWLTAPNGVIAELVGLRDHPDEPGLGYVPDYSLDTDDGCDWWINRLWNAICEHRGSYLDADRVFDVFGEQSTARVSVPFRLWTFVRQANRAGVNDRDAARQWLEKEKNVQLPIHDREIDAAIKMLTRERKRRRDKKQKRA